MSMKPAIFQLFYCGILASLMAWGSSTTADTSLGMNHISYWRDQYQELKPEDDSRVKRAKAIFKRLTQVAGKRPDVDPKLFIITTDPWKRTLPFALPQGWIILSKGVLDICYREPIKGDDRLAFILGHELSHQLSGDVWHLRFFQAVDASSRQQNLPPELLAELQRAAFNTEQGVQRELHADERGIIYAALAGFDPHAIVTADDSVNFFAEWVSALPRDIFNESPSDSIRLTPQKRAAMLKNRLHEVLDQTAAFHAGLWWYYAGDYPQAIQAFKHFRELFAGREVIHNLATSHHRLALQMYQAWQPDQRPVPFHMSMAGLDRGIGHFMLFEVDSKARAPAPLIPKSPQTSSAASDRKSARLPSSRQVE